MDIFIDLKVEKENVAIIKEMLPYTSEHIKNIVQIEEDDIIKIYCDEQYKANVEESIGKLNELISDKFFKDKKISTTRIEDWTDKSVVNSEDIFTKLQRTSEIYDTADGTFAYSGLPLKIFEYFISKIDEYAKEVFADYSIKRHKVPALYSVDGYQKGGYFETFPHHIMFETTSVNNLENIEKFSKASNFAEANIGIKKPQNILRTASCAPIYKYLENTIISEDTKDVYIVTGTCFRNESDNIRSLSRLNEFTMKEYVFVGSENFIEDSLNKATKLWEYWVKVFSLNSKIETATDSFFASKYQKLKLFQALGKSKVEFKCLIPAEDSYISCSSKNYHRTHFSSKYNIHYLNDNTLAQSACFAFGIDRLMYAFLSQKGTEIEKWDRGTISEITKYVDLD